MAHTDLYKPCPVFSFTVSFLPAEERQTLLGLALHGSTVGNLAEGHGKALLPLKIVHPAPIHIPLGRNGETVGCIFTSACLAINPLPKANDLW